MFVWSLVRVLFNLSGAAEQAAMGFTVCSVSGSHQHPNSGRPMRIACGRRKGLWSWDAHVSVGITQELIPPERLPQPLGSASSLTGKWARNHHQGPMERAKSVPEATERGVGLCLCRP